MSQAKMEMSYLRSEAKDHPETHKGWKQKVIPLRKQLTGRTLTALLIQFAAVGLLLLLASVHVEQIHLGPASACEAYSARVVVSIAVLSET